MKISATWTTPLTLTRIQRTTKYQIDLERVPEKPGVYVFAIKFGNSIDAIYVGKAKNLRARIRTQLKNNDLMNALTTNSETGKSKIGTRLVFPCPMKVKPGQKVEKLLVITERALLEHFLHEGHSLVNDKGSKRPIDSISFTGNKDSQRLVGSKSIEIPARK